MALGRWLKYKRWIKMARMSSRRLKMSWYRAGERVLVLIKHRWRLLRASFRAPPFMLWAVSEKCLPHLTETPCISAEHHTESHDQADEHQTASWQRDVGLIHGNLYLWPDGLRHWYFWPALGLAFYLGFFDSLLLGLLTLFWLAVAAPLIVFFLLRRQVLEGIWKGVPTGSWYWLTSVPKWQSHPETPDLACCRDCNVVSWLKALAGLLQHSLPDLTERRDPVIWQGRSCPQGAILTVASAEFFASNDRTDIWCNRGFLRWLFYWCLPLWSGYLWLLFLTALETLGFIRICSEQLGVAILIWTLYSAIFLQRQLCSFVATTQFNDPNYFDNYRTALLDDLPLDLWYRVKHWQTDLKMMPVWGWQAAVTALLGGTLTLFNIIVK